jgi:hypothetical protein
LRWNVPHARDLDGWGDITGVCIFPRNTLAVGVKPCAAGRVFPSPLELVGPWADRIGAFAEIEGARKPLSWSVWQLCRKYCISQAVLVYVARA